MRPYHDGVNSPLLYFKDFCGGSHGFKISPVTSAHTFLYQTSQSILSYVPLLIRMWYTLCDRSATYPFLPVVSWCKDCPILPFFLFEIVCVVESASSSVFSDSCLEIIFPLLQNPTSFTMNCCVLVARTNLPFHFAF